jgi:hypothetical protein
MNGNLFKLISSATAAFAVGSSAFAQSSAECCPTSCPKVCTYEPGNGLCNDKFPAAYNAPARIDVKCSWDLFVTGSFIYWHADQDGMTLAYPAIAGSTVPAPGIDRVMVQNFTYKPGFKVGLGANFDHDNWVGFVEYTWFHQTTTTSNQTAASGLNLYSPWFSTTANLTGLSSKWRTNLDILDATMSRPFYQGRYLTIVPFGGLRGAWIRQNLRLAGTSTVFSSPVSHNHSNSWAVGPRCGLQSHWLLGWGFRVEGDVAGSLLYTRYTSVTHRDDTTNFTVGFNEFNTVRPMADMGLGLGWGSYFDCQNYHFDLLATYDFNVMWGQNMIRYAANQGQSYAGLQPADLHLQGLTFDSNRAI